jgi:hypothetical protein
MPAKVGDHSWGHRLAALLQGCGDEGSAAVDADDQPAFAKHGHGVADGDVGDAVLFGERAFCGELAGYLAGLDPPGDVFGYLDVGMVAPVRVDRLGRHVLNVGACRANETFA